MYDYFINTCFGYVKYSIFTSSIRIAETIRGLRTLKFAQKDGLLAAFFELFFMKFWLKKSKNKGKLQVKSILFCCFFDGIFSYLLIFIPFQKNRRRFSIRQHE
jgi:hypothetical protein